MALFALLHHVISPRTAVTKVQDFVQYHQMVKTELTKAKMQLGL